MRTGPREEADSEKMEIGVLFWMAVQKPTYNSISNTACRRCLRLPVAVRQWPCSTRQERSHSGQRGGTLQYVPKFIFLPLWPRQLPDKYPFSPPRWSEINPTSLVQPSVTCFSNLAFPLFSSERIMRVATRYLMSSVPKCECWETSIYSPISKPHSRPGVSKPV